MIRVLVVLAVVVAGCSAAVVPSAPPASSGPTTQPTATPTEPEATDPPDPTDEPAAGVYAARLGEAVAITCDGEPCETVTVVKIAWATRYRDPDRSYPLDDVPAKGMIYLAVYVKYQATGSGASYGPFDWSVFVNDNAVDDFTYVSHGPTPDLNSGTLPTGKTAAGWIVYEVPKAGRVTIDYQPGREAIFEIVLRER